MNFLKPNDQRARYAIIFLWINFGLNVLSLISSYFQYSLIDSVESGIQISIEDANANDSRESIMGILGLTGYIIGAITFILWFRRAFYNLQLKVDNLSNTDGWAAGSWFVPVLCLFRPYQIMKELYVETKNLLWNKGYDVQNILPTTFLGIWWTLWIINNFFGQFILKNSLNAEEINEIKKVTTLSIVSEIIYIPLTLLAIKVIKEYSKIEPILMELEDPEEEYTSNENTDIEHSIE